MRARAFTLIEVVASLALIAATVTALLQIQGQSLAQLHALDEQQTAASLARELIADWNLSPLEARTATQGPFDLRPGWRWTRKSQPYPDAQKLKLEQITLDIHRAGIDGENRQVVSFTWLEPRDRPPG